jgi:predicted nucleotidyltransferase
MGCATDRKEPYSVDETVSGIVRRLVDAYHPERVYLFGSVARGEAGKNSDYDFMVIVPDDAPQSFAPAQRVTARFVTFRFPLTSLSSARAVSISDCT